MEDGFSSGAGPELDKLFVNLLHADGCLSLGLRSESIAPLVMRRLIHVRHPLRGVNGRAFIFV